MDKYTLLILLNLPLVILAVLDATLRYKLGKTTRQRTLLLYGFWTIIILGLFLAEHAYRALLDSGLTDSESLSVFDVIQITAIVLLLYMFLKLYSKLSDIEQRTQKLHRTLSINLSRSELDNKKTN